MDILKREVSFDDSDLIFEWRNSPDARLISQKPNEISLYEHKSWMRSRILRIPDEPFWIMSLNEKYIGYIRLDLLRKGQKIFNVSIFVVPEFRNIGIGKRMLSIALESAAPDSPETIFLAIIKKDNVGSIKLFTGLGFKKGKEFDNGFNEYLLRASEILK